MSDLTVTIITPDAKQEDFSANSIVVPLEDGYWGILPKHSNMVAVLSSGKIKIKLSGKEIQYQIEEGWIEVFHNRIIILTPDFVPVN
jgi:F-type H+-transporting ATPase subunit epsilon